MPVDETAIARSLAAVEWPRILQALEVRIATCYGAAQLGSLHFLDNLDLIRQSLARIQEMRGLIESGGVLSFSGIRPLGDTLDRAEKAGRLEVQELAAVLSTQKCIVETGVILLQATESPLLRDAAAEVHREEDLIAVLGAAITPTGELNERNFPTLAALRDEIGQRREAIHRHLEGILRTRQLDPVLQDKVFTLRGHRYVVPVKSEFKGQLPGIVHDVSSSGMTLFVEPQAIVDETNALTLVERQLDIELDRILRELSGRVGFSASSLRHNIGWIGRIDLLHAQAVLSRDLHGAAPKVGLEQVIDLRGLAHPLMLLAREEVVRNDVTLGSDIRCLIISGANTGGKTVLLKAIGLCALLVRAGMHVPAQPGSRLDLFTGFWADIGDQQDLRTSLSTYSAQIEFLSRVLNAAGADSLVLLDELMTGTEPIEGAALARQVLEALVSQGAKSVITTHYGELKLLADRVSGVANGSVSFDGEKLRPTYRFTLGMPGASYALPIASRYGLPDDLVRRAQEGLAGHPAELDTLLRQLHAQEAALAAQRSDFEHRLAQLERRELDAERRSTHLDELQSRLKRQERGAVSDELRAARRRIADVIHDLQGANSLPIAGKVRARLTGLEAELLPPAPLPAAPGAGEAIEVGGSVYVASLERSGVLQEVIDDGETARVQFGQLTLEIPFEQVLPAHTTPAAVPRRTRGGRSASPNRLEPALAAVSFSETEPDIPHVFQTADNTLDLRGRTLEDAAIAADAFFDQCIVKHVDPVLVIHGHGTGRLKAGLREHFRSSRYVVRFRPGGPGEGRDGVTVVSLDI